MKRNLVIIFLTFLSFSLFPQKGTIKGKVFNAKTNEPIEFLTHYPIITSSHHHNLSAVADHHITTLSYHHIILS